MRSTNWGTEESSNIADIGHYRYRKNKGLSMPVTEVRFFKRFDRPDYTERRVVFIVRSLNKLEAGQIIWDRRLKKACFVSTIQTFDISALTMITEFIKALNLGLVDDLVLCESNEIILPV